jgi:quinol monooxygenase YgiN
MIGTADKAHRNDRPEIFRTADRNYPNSGQECVMVKLGFLATMVAKPGKADELAAFLTSALPLAEAEPGTVTWYAAKIDDSTYAIFDTFDTEDARQAHINGPIASALMARAGELLAEPPSIKPIDVLAAK